MNSCICKFNRKIFAPTQVEVGAKPPPPLPCYVPDPNKQLDKTTGNGNNKLHNKE